MRARIRIDQLPGRRYANGRRIEDKFLRVLHEMKQVRVASAELVLAVDAEGVIPDHPASAVKSQFSLENELCFRGELVPNRQPECSRGLKRANQHLAPFSSPAKVFVRGSTVLVNIVFVSDVEWWVGEGKIDRSGRNSGHSCDAIFVVDL